MEMALKVPNIKLVTNLTICAKKKKFLGFKKMRGGGGLTPSKLPFRRRVGPQNYHANIQAGS